MAWYFTDPVIVPQAMTDLSTTAKLTPGTIRQAKDSSYGVGEFIYLGGVASCAAKDWVTYNLDDRTVTRLAANAIGPVAIAMAACTASYYGWFQISGEALGNCLTQMASGNRVWITGTAGSVDDASVAGDGVHNAKATATATVGDLYTSFAISRPFVDDFTSFS